jgi:hypothetical protein
MKLGLGPGAISQCRLQQKTVSVQDIRLRACMEGQLTKVVSNAVSVVKGEMCEGRGVTPNLFQCELWRQAVLLLPVLVLNAPQSYLSNKQSINPIIQN